VLAAAGPDYFRWVPHPEVWLLVGSLIGLYTYAVRVIGPKAVPAGTPAVTKSQRNYFIAGIVLLEVAADWPVHDIGEDYLYLVHMCQHLALTMVLPPLMLWATPEWLARLVLGTGRVNRLVHRMAKPVPAAGLFSVLLLATHAPFVVNNATQNAVFHYGVHTTLVTAAFLLWLPVCGPLPEVRISAPAQMIYLFVSSVVPTVPGAWLTFADGAVYRVYDIPNRLWGVSVTSDQQVAGMIMKLVGGTYLWVIIVVIFFKWVMENDRVDRAERTQRRLTFEDVQAEFDEHPPAPTAVD
jgi:putative membrane protein